MEAFSLDAFVSILSHRSSSGSRGVERSETESTQDLGEKTVELGEAEQVS
jgi:hypothetical protein